MFQASSSSDSLDGPCVDYAKSYDAVVFDVLKVTPEEFAVSTVHLGDGSELSSRSLMHHAKAFPGFQEELQVGTAMKCPGAGSSQILTAALLVLAPPPHSCSKKMEPTVRPRVGSLGLLQRGLRL